MQLAFFSLNLAFETRADSVTNWYEALLNEPQANYRLVTEWFELARQKCVGWTFTPFGSFDYGMANYKHVEPALRAGIGSYILEDRED